MVALAAVDRLGGGVVGAPAVAQLHDGEGVVLEAEVVAEAIGLVYAGVCRRSVSEAVRGQRVGAREGLLLGVEPVFMSEQYLMVNEAARFDMERRATTRDHRPERSGRKSMAVAGRGARRHWTTRERESRGWRRILSAAVVEDRRCEKSH